MKTYSPRPQDARRDWHVIDAEGKILGRMATEIATKLRGKNKPEFAPHMDMGDFVIVVNADKVKVTGNKLSQKKYYRHTGYPGGIREISLEKLLDKKPEEVIRHSVRGMLPKNKIGRNLLKKLKVYSGPDHPHSAQKPLNQDN
ncbi:50S ribosomal protein L13 [Desulfonatronovibrio magnus]|uniref:50S ribosomal protein L13 n=1 Tax=Desulfonatronovibrio magnus TaxID=698827 RepID=UPI0005EBCDD1|nr:50S ribosomal protein L13 [Desulfonatronovibrio magnus]